jgi:hypothetical protein
MKREVESVSNSPISDREASGLTSSVKVFELPAEHFKLRNTDFPGAFSNVSV